jgi:selenocysteine lyase/cysteine desulfurase
VIATGPDTFRTRFPMLERTTHLATCSLGARSLDLDQALTGMLDAMAGHGAPWRQFEGQLDEARARFAALIGARPDQVAVVPNVSVGAYQVASTMAWDRRPEVVTTSAEFPSVAHVWLAQRRRGAEVRFVGERGAAAAAEDYVAAIDGGTGLVSIPLVTYRTATRLPVTEVVAAAHAAGARAFVDAYQAVGVEPVDVNELGCDYLAAGSLKYLLGLPGVAFLYARSIPPEDPAPTLTGWFGRVDPFAFDPHRLDFPDHARRFEIGTPAVPAVYAANAGLELIGRLDLHEVRRHVATLVARAAGGLSEQGERLDLPANPSDRGAHVALVDPDPAALAEWLALRGIAVSPRGDVVRLSFHHYSNVGDVEMVCEEIGRYRRASHRHD